MVQIGVRDRRGARHRTDTCFTQRRMTAWIHVQRIAARPKPKDVTVAVAIARNHRRAGASDPEFNRKVLHLQAGGVGDGHQRPSAIDEKALTHLGSAKGHIAAKRPMVSSNLIQSIPIALPPTD